MSPLPTAQRTVIVTGGAKGIGAAVSEHLAKAGWHLFLCGRDAAALEATAARLRSTEVDVQWAALDLGEPGAVTTLFSRWTRPEDLPAALVCGAANYGVLGPLEAVDFGAWKRSFDLNFFSVAETLHRFLDVALRGPPSPRRRIVVMGGSGLGSAEVPRAVSAYTCAKAALNRLVEAVHEEVHARGIDINCVLPGLVATGMVDQAIAAGPVLGPLYEASLKARGGAGMPPGVAAEMIAHLLSGACDGLSGRLLSARWDRRIFTAPAEVANDRDLFRLRRVDDELFGKCR